jgi:hypothetical protein
MEEILSKSVLPVAKETSRKARALSLRLSKQFSTFILYSTLMQDSLAL